MGLYIVFSVADQSGVKWEWTVRFVDIYTTWKQPETQQQFDIWASDPELLCESRQKGKWLSSEYGEWNTIQSGDEAEDRNHRGQKYIVNIEAEADNMSGCVTLHLFCFHLILWWHWNKSQQDHWRLSVTLSIDMSQKDQWFI